ncbi:MAG TPA: YihY/virulence factor BrkB family protein, partial [Galbitalea sp.]
MAEQKANKPKKPNRFAPLIGWVTQLFVVRVFLSYSKAQGPLLASGLAYQAIFAVFAGLWVGFSIVGLIVAGDAALQQPLIDFLATSVPGLIKTSSGSGAIDPKVLLSAGTFTLSGIIALVGVLVTALGWLASARTAIRIIFGLPQPTTNFFLLKLRDLAVALGFGIALVVSAALSVAGSAATGFGLGLLGISPHSLLGNITAKTVTITLSFALDAVILGALFRVLSGVDIPWRRLVGGVILGAVALGALKTLGGSLLGVSKSNPLLASFAVILGLLIFFNVVCQVILISASWISVGMADRHIAMDPAGEAARLEQERKDGEAATPAEPTGIR